MANDQAARDLYEADGFRTEVAEQFGFETTNDDANEYKCTQAQLVNFAKACERAGMWQAHAMGSRDLVAKRMMEIDAELGPILEAERQRYLTARGHVPVDASKPEGGWVKPCL